MQVVLAYPTGVAAAKGMATTAKRMPRQPFVSSASDTTIAAMALCAKMALQTDSSCMSAATAPLDQCYMWFRRKNILSP